MNAEDIWTSLRVEGVDEPANWKPLRYSHNRNVNMMFWDDEVSHSGTRSVKISVEELDPEYPDIDRCWDTRIDGGELVGKQITLRFFLRTEGISSEGQASASIQCWESTDDWLARDPQFTASKSMYLGASTVSVQGTTDWTEYCVSLIMHEDASWIHIYLGMTGVGTCWYDDVSVTVDDLCDSEAAKTFSWIHEVVEDPNAPKLLPVRRNPEAAPPADPAETKPWTLILYDDAEFPGANPIDYFAGEVQSSESVHVLILEDPIDGDARTWNVERVGEEAVLTCVAENGEPNMSDGATLSELLMYAKTWYPSDRIMLMVYDHGHGWWGACRDHTNNDMTLEPWQSRDWMTPMEMSEALEGNGGIDALLFTAPCLMAALETAYEVRHQTSLYVGSQENSGYMVWLGTMGPIAEYLTSHPNVETTTLGRFIIETLLVRNEENPETQGESWNRVLSAIDCGSLEGIAPALDTFSRELIRLLDVSFDQIEAARSATQSFGLNEMIDVIDFSYQCALRISEIVEAAADLQKQIYGSVIGSLWDSKHMGSHGLTLHFPYPDPTFPEESAVMAYSETGETYAAYGLSLLQETAWDEFLSAFFARWNAPDAP